MSAQLFTAAAVTTYAVTPGRLVASIAALVAVAGVIVGGLAMARPTARRRGALMALAAGLAAIVTGALVVALAKGGPGTGYGIVGGYASLVIGLLATLLGWLALSRSRRAA
jgi:hypothetical protein